MRAISLLADDLLACWEDLCSMKLISLVGWLVLVLSLVS